MEQDNSELAAWIYAQQRNAATLQRVLGEDHPHIRKLMLSTALAQAAEKVEQKLPVTILFPHRSLLLFTHTRRLLTWRGRRHSYINTSYLLIRTLSSFCFLDLSMDIANS